MQLTIVRRWGSNLPGDTVDVADQAQARWLLDNHFATFKGHPEAATSGAAAPGTHGPDVKAGGDHTRRRPATRKAEYGPNRARPVAGSPVAYTAGVAEPVASARLAAASDEAAASEDSGEGSEPVASKPSTKLSGSGRRRNAD